MDALISTFHLDLKLILAQAVNFFIVLAVLYFAALKPLMKIMQDRTDKIDKSLRDAEHIDKKLKETEAKTRQMILEAQNKANDILESTQADAEEKRQQMLTKAKHEIEKLIMAGKVSMAEEKERMVEEARAEVGSLVIKATEKLLGGELPKHVNADMVKEVVDQL